MNKQNNTCEPFVGYTAQPRDNLRHTNHDLLCSQNVSLEELLTTRKLQSPLLLQNSTVQENLSTTVLLATDIIFCLLSLLQLPHKTSVMFSCGHEKRSERNNVKGIKSQRTQNLLPLI